MLSQSNRTSLICFQSVLLTVGATSGRFAVGRSVRVHGVGVLGNSEC